VELLREGRHLLLAASELESRIKRVATGYEVELRVAVDDIIPMERLHPLFRKFTIRGLARGCGFCWRSLAGRGTRWYRGAPIS